MAKNTIPGFKASGGTLKKLVGFAVVVAILVLVVQYPGDAAAMAKGAAGFVVDVIDGIVSFFRQVG
ncbi:hypothetical protein [Amycolatopsis suaedae]|uniref:Uncharacterized protein n=1 Tax=Amycolatopsis suaedae TaxID=2510978 RepID=A0A4Q7J9I2_9PSEU|nr:hypothetical protein [Amycolatopsis suaedae]RZQ64421.1 hypothetical protein EWH70_10705 [Amycolatopsis suaedae]